MGVAAWASMKGAQRAAGGGGSAPSNARQSPAAGQGVERSETQLGKEQHVHASCR